MAVYVSNPAGRIGRYFSRASYKSIDEVLLPSSGVEAFESLIGVNDVRRQREMSVMLKDPNVRTAIQQLKKRHNIDDDLNDDLDTLHAVIDLKLAEEFENDKPEHTLKMYAEGKIDIKATTANTTGTTTGTGTGSGTKEVHEEHTKTE